MRVCIRKSDNRIIEAQSNDDASLDALRVNAKAAGFADTDVDIKVIPDAEFKSMMAAQAQAEAAARPVKTVADKLATIGLTVAELKAELALVK